MLWKARQSSWKLFCKQVDSVYDTLKIKNIQSENPLHAETLSDDEGNKMETFGTTFAASEEEAAEELFQQKDEHQVIPTTK